MKKKISDFAKGFLSVLERMHINRVFITSLIFSVALVVQEMASNKDQSLKAYMLAICIAGIGFLSNTWKAKSLTLAGQLLAAVPALIERADGETISWPQLFITLLLAFAAAFMGSGTPAEPQAGQERTPKASPKGIS